MSIVGRPSRLRSLLAQITLVADVPSLERITPVILTLDEEPNIGRTLSKLEWASHVLVVDSGSEDRTPEIVRSFENTDLLFRGFDTHHQQWNFALDQVESDWMLALDADYQVPPEAVAEIKEISNDTPKAGFFAAFDLIVLGRRLVRSLYPPRQVLFRTGRAVFEDDGHTQRVRVDGPSGRLEHRLVHEDRKPFDRWLNNQIYYARREVRKLSSTPWSELSLPDQVRRTRVLGPPGVLLYCLLGKALLLEGWAGWYYTLERTLAEIILSLEMIRGD